MPVIVIGTVAPAWPMAGDMEVMVGVVALGACTVTVILELPATELAPLSLACTKKVYDPAAVGVPDSAPLAKFMPVGNVPLKLHA